MPRLVRLYIQQITVGLGLAALLVGLLLAFDIAGLRELIAERADGPLRLVLAWVLNGLFFAAVQCALVVLGRPDDDDDGPPDHGGDGWRDDGRVRIPLRVRR